MRRTALVVHIATLLLVGISGVCAQPAEEVVRVVVTGAYRLGDGRVRLLAREENGVDAIAARYGELGLWNAVIEDTLTDGGRTRRIEVSEGPPASIRVADSLGSIGNPASVLTWSKRLLRREADRGHPFARLSLVSASEVAPGEYELEAQLDPGPEVTVVAITPIGNTITQNAVIRRELRHRPAWRYSQDAVDLWKRRLRNSGYFGSVSDPELVLRDSASGAADLVVHVTEGRPNKFEGVVGYQPAAAGSNKKGTFTGLVNLVLGNLWGSGRRLSANWERPEEATTTLALAYREPWVAGQPLDAEVRLDIQQRLGYAVEQFELYLGAEVVPELTIGGTVGREIVRSDSIALLGAPRHSGLVLSAEVDYDTRDDALNPSSGVRYQFSWSGSFRTNGVNDPDFVALFGENAWPESERTSTAQVDLEHFIGVGRFVTIAAGWHGAQVTSNERNEALGASDQFLLGGIGTVRGYQQDQFSGDIAAWGNHELRYRVGPASRLFAFVDIGAIRSRRYDTDTGVTTETMHWPVGYGVGLRARTAAGVLGIDFGWGREDSFGQGKVHVRLETVF